MSDQSTMEQGEAPAQVVDAPVADAPVDAPVEETTAEKVENKPKEESEEKPEAKPEEAENKTESVESAKNTQNGEENGSSQNGRPVAKKNSKFDPSVLPVTDDPEAIRAQVEFYFGDSNLPTDKFMWNSTGGTDNKAMSLKVICSFKRMQRFQPYTAVVAALRESKLLEVTGDEGNELVKRVTPYKSVPLAQKQRLAKSVYIKGFGEEQKTTQFDIEQWLANYGAVDKVKLRRDENDEFKGSIFVEFKTEELAKNFVSLSPAPMWNGNELKIMSKAGYMDEKTRQIQAGEIEPSKKRPPTFFEGREKGGNQARGQGRAGNDGNKDNWKQRRDDDRKRDGRNGRGRGRGGRGGRGGGRGFKGGRGDRDRQDRGNKDKDDGPPKSTNNVQRPTIQATTQSNGNKRSREDDGGEAPPAKKVDTKTEAVAV
ncbi:La protein [Echria macrotheca]|uniref:La protein n=1 Tax=Echria macrotheca TaxID=438768 RepID=A0AAJ0BJE0_9PEZI|nr:La protein [Echria macrotheca]